MAKTIKDLILAFLNATLILVAVCLVLLLMVYNKANSISASFAENLTLVAPLQDSFSQVSVEMKSLQEEINGFQTEYQFQASARLTELQTKLESVETRLLNIQDSLTDLKQAPELLIDKAIKKTADQAVLSVAQLRGCVPNSNSAGADS